MTKQNPRPLIGIPCSLYPDSWFTPANGNAISYLRAIDTASIEDPHAMARLRAQMLRRIQIVVGEGRVRDLLITEFVLN